MDLVLHIGLEKTATTSIQQAIRALADNYDHIGAPKSPVAYEQNMAGLVLLCRDTSVRDDLNRYVRANSDAELLAFQEDLKIKLGDEIDTMEDNGVETVIISSEHFHSRLVELESIENLEKLLKAYFDKISVHVYLRRQDKLVQSLYTTSLLNGHAMHWEAFSSANFGYYLDYLKICEQWSQVFGTENFNVHVFERALQHPGGVVQHFIDAVGLTGCVAELEDDSLNVSLSSDAQKLLVAYNKFLAENGLNTPPQDKRVRLASETLHQMLSWVSSGKGEAFDGEKSAEFMSRFELDNKRLAQKFLDREEIFLWR